MYYNTPFASSVVWFVETWSRWVSAWDLPLLELDAGAHNLQEIVPERGITLFDLLSIQLADWYCNTMVLIFIDRVYRSNMGIDFTPNSFCFSLNTYSWENVHIQLLPSKVF